jgi:hypothetical protein
LQAGPEGCGKSTLLDYCFSRLHGKVTVARVHCSAQTTADSVIQKLLQVGKLHGFDLERLASDKFLNCTRFAEGRPLQLTAYMLIVPALTFTHKPVLC